VFANEFFDALPVEILGPKGSLRIDASDGHFIETWARPSPEEMEFLDRYSVHPEPDEHRSFAGGSTIHGSHCREVQARVYHCDRLRYLSEQACRTSSAERSSLAPAFNQRTNPLRSSWRSGHHR